MLTLFVTGIAYCTVFTVPVRGSASIHAVVTAPTGLDAMPRLARTPAAMTVASRRNSRRVDPASHPAQLADSSCSSFFTSLPSIGQLASTTPAIVIVTHNTMLILAEAARRDQCGPAVAFDSVGLFIIRAS